MKKILLIVTILMFLASSALGGGALIPLPKVFFLNDQGKPCVGCRVCTFSEGSSTPKLTYSDEALTVPNSNPIILNNRGEGSIWLDGKYRIKLLPATESDCLTGTSIFTVDHVSAQPYGSLAISQWVASAATPVFISASSFSVSGDFSPTLEIGRRIQLIDGSSTLYGRITGSTYSAATNRTTITVALDSGTFTSSLSAVNMALLTVTGSSVSVDLITSGTTSANIISTGTITASGPLNVTGDINSSGTNTFSGTSYFGLISAVTDSTKTTNLNADLVDGFHVSQTPTANAISVRTATNDLLDRNSNILFSAGTPTGGATGSTVTTVTPSFAVTSGDILFVALETIYTASATGVQNISIGTSGGATHFLAGDTLTSYVTVTSGSVYRTPLFGMVFVTSTGNMTIQGNIGGSSPTNITNTIGYAFIKKQ